MTNDVSTSKQTIPAGVGIGTITGVAGGGATTNYHGWIQIGGYHSAVDTDAGDDIVKGDPIIVHVSTDGVCDRGASITGGADTFSIGITTAADVDADDTVAAILKVSYGDIIQ